MKNILKTLIAIIIILSFNSCESELDLKPNNSVTPEIFYQNNDDYTIAGKGLASALIKTNFYGPNGILSRPEIATENVIIAQNGRKSNQVFNEWRYAAGNSWDFTYPAYVLINRSNMMIANIDNLNDGDDKNNFLGMAKASRALAMFDMLRVHSKIPTQSADANGSLGMSIISDISGELKPRNTVGECYTWVINELESAKTLIKSSNSNTEMNLDAINALLSRVYLYNGEYQKCIDAANDVVTTVSSIADFPDVWTDAGTEGVIFKVDQSRVVDNISIGNDWSQSNAGIFVPEYAMSFELFNLYQASDVRKNSYTFSGPDSDGNNYNIIGKYLGEAGQNNGKVDPKVLRAAEVYLNKAEAYSMLTGGDADALAALNEVRQNRYSGFVNPGETGTALMDAIKLERRLEFFAEGHYFFDVKRWGGSISRSATDGDFSDGTGTPYAADYQNLSQGDHKFQFPILQAEIDIYPSLQQNPGY